MGGFSAAGKFNKSVFYLEIVKKAKVDFQVCEKTSQMRQFVDFVFYLSVQYGLISTSFIVVKPAFERTGTSDGFRMKPNVAKEWKEC